MGYNVETNDVAVSGPGLSDLLKLMFGRMPGQLVIQYSDACNALCPQCELRVSNRFRRSRIAIDDMKRMIDAAAVKGVSALSFTGGEPFLYPNEIVELLKYASAAGIPYTRTGTNGFFFAGTDKPDWEGRIRHIASSLAETNIYTFWISVDSSDATLHEEMRGLPGVIDGIEKALPIFHEYGIYPCANLGVNRNVGGRWNDSCDPPSDGTGYERFYSHFRVSFDAFYRFVANLGFTTANACYPMSVETQDTEALDSVYGASSTDIIVKFTGSEKALLFRALLDTIPDHAGSLRIFTPLSSLYALTRLYSGESAPEYPCPGGISYFFVDAEKGHAYPCGFRGSEDLGKFDGIDLDALQQEPYCTACDWECFRDPAYLAGPLRALTRRPLTLAGDILKNRDFYRLWLRDLKYSRAAGYYLGRVAPDYTRLERVGSKRLLPELYGASLFDTARVPSVEPVGK